MGTSNSLNKKHSQNYWVVGIVFAIAMIVTVFAWLYERGQNFSDGQLRFEQASTLLLDDLLSTMHTYDLFLHGGVGHIRAKEDVSRQGWRTYFEVLDLETNYPGIQGVGYNVVLRNSDEAAQFEANIRASDWPKYKIKPEGTRDFYTPVLFLEPLNSSNETAIGFDIYSEENRRTAVDRAIDEGEPALTAKIRLVQEDKAGGPDKEQAGVLLILPVYKQRPDLTNTENRRASTDGLIVSVFRMGDLMESILAKQAINAQERIAVRLYDTALVIDDNLMYSDLDFANGKLAGAQFRTTQTFEIFGRNWTFQTISKPAFETEVSSTSAAFVLGAGTLLSLLLMSLAWGQAIRIRDSVAAADELSESQKQIKILMGEVNHRSKNLLALVQAIARQTSANDPEKFMVRFSERLSALSASQDLLVKNEWKEISLRALITSQLAHFEGLVGKRIIIKGNDVPISAAAAQTIGMATHELATNAGKYGALSNDRGTITIQWSTKADGSFKLSWVEKDGPPVSAPTTEGFGSKVIGMMAKVSLEADVDMLYEPTGFIWRIKCPISCLSEQTEANTEMRA